MLDAHQIILAHSNGGIPDFFDTVFFFPNVINKDSRGEFSRIFDYSYPTVASRIKPPIQISFSHNVVKGTRRGMHVQMNPSIESKLVRVLRGGIVDVIVDCRPKSKTFGSWISAELTSDNGIGLHVPPGFAHGIQTLVDDTIVAYAMDVVFDSSRDVSINTADPTLGISWPGPAVIQSEKDLAAISWEIFCEKFPRENS